MLVASPDMPPFLARNKLNASFIASPAIAGDAMILRSTTHLYCLVNGYKRTAEQVARDIYPPAGQAGKPRKSVAAGKPVADRARRLSRLGARLKQLVTAGKITEEEARGLYQLAVEVAAGK